MKEYDMNSQQQANDLLASSTANFVAYLATEYKIPLTQATFLCGMILLILPQKLHEQDNLRESIRQIVLTKFTLY